MIRLIQTVVAVVVAMGTSSMTSELATKETTIIVNGHVVQVESRLDDDHLWVSPADFQKINGFELKPEGACFKDICVPLRQDSNNEFFIKDDDQAWINVSAFAEKIQQSYVVDRDANVWSFGMVPKARESFLKSAIAPEFELTDRHGKTVKLSDFRGKKVLIITWASW